MPNVTVEQDALDALRRAVVGARGKLRPDLKLEASEALRERARRLQTEADAAGGADA